MRRALRIAGGAVGVTATFIVATVGGVLLHINLPVTRRAIATQVNGILAATLEGKIEIERVGRIGLHGLDGIDATIRDPEGVQVIHVDGIRVRVDTIEAARSAVLEKGEIRVFVTSLSIDNANVAIDGNAKGDLRLATTFVPKNKDKPKDDKPGRDVRVEAPEVILRHAWVHGAVPGAPPVDVDLAGFAAHAHYDAKSVRADLDHLAVVARAMPMGADPNGVIGAHFAMPLETGGEMSVQAAFDGSVGGMPTKLEAKMDGQRIDARIDTEDPKGERVAQVSSLPIHDPVTLHAEAHGVLPKIDATAKVGLGKATVDVASTIETGDTIRVAAKVGARHVDIHAVAPNAPASDLGLDADGKVAIHGDEISGEIAVDTLPGVIDKERLPTVHASGDFTKDTANVRARINEAMAPTDVTVAVRPDGEGRVIDATVHATLPDLEHLPKVGSVASGKATIDARGRFALPSKTFDAHVDVHGTGIARDANYVDDIKVEARAKGTPDRVEVEVDSHARGLASGEQEIESVDASAKVGVEIARKITTVRDARVDIVRQGAPLGVRAALVRVEGTNVDVQDASVEGLGKPIHANVTKDAAGVRIALDAPEIDLVRVSHLAGADNLRQGVLAVNAELALKHEQATGFVRARAENLSAEQIDGATIDMEAAIDRRVLTFDIDADLGEAGQLSFEATDLTLSGSPANPVAWKTASGSAKLEADLDIARLASLVPEGALPISEVRGRLIAQGRFGRDDAESAPEIDFHTHTKGLVATGVLPPAPDPNAEAPKRRFRRPKVAKPWHTEGIDVGLEVHTDARSDWTGAAVRLTDAGGLLVALDAKALVPYEELIDKPSLAKAYAIKAPFHARLSVPRRELDSLPPMFGVEGVAGAVDADLDVDGTALEPRVHLVAHGRGVRASAAPISADSDIDLKYDGQAADLAAQVRTTNRAQLDIASHVDVRSRELVEGTGGVPAWKASGKVKLASFPLESIPALESRRIRGNVSGEVSLDRLHEDAELRVKVGVDGLTVGNSRYKTAAIGLQAGRGRFEANARIEQTDGFADLRASSGLAWGKEVAPKLDPAKPIETRLLAKAFSIGVAQPFIDTAVHTLDGRLEGEASLKMRPDGKDTRMNGKIILHDGVVQLVAVGDELRNVRATVDLHPDGTIKVDDIYARGAEGEVTADAMVKLDGLRLSHAKANLLIPDDHPLDVAVKGQPIGDVSCKVAVDARSTPDGNLAIVADVPKLHVQLPRELKSDVQTVEQKKNIRVGVYRDKQSFERVALLKDDVDPAAQAEKKAAEASNSRLDVDVRLGSVQIDRRNSASIQLTGNPKIAVARETKVTGQLRLTGGWADVQGKKFKIERGTVTFHGESPPNPVVVATAGWRARDRSMIYADFVGPVTTGKLNLRSEPPRSRNEIVSMIMFGSPDGTNTTRQQKGGGANKQTSAGVAVGGDFATQGLTEALDDLAGIQATARIDTSRASNPRPELEVQLSQQISVGFSTVLGKPPPTEPDKYYTTVGYRFQRNWSLETTLGSAGRAMLDAVWQKRY